MKLSELKHSYRDSNPRPAHASPQDSRLAEEIQEQQSILKAYEVMVKKFQSQIQNRETEILQLQQKIQESNQKKMKLEKKIKQRGLLAKESEDFEEENGYFSVELNPSLFSTIVDAAYKSIHDFSKPLMNMMKAAGWDLDAAARSIDPAVTYVKRAHKKYAFESYICQRIFGGFNEESFSVDTGDLKVSNEGFFHQFLAIRAMDPLDILSQSPDSLFGKFCRSKYLLIVHPRWRDRSLGIWIKGTILAYSFDPKVKVFQVRRGTDFSEVYMESVAKDVVLSEGGEMPKAALMVMPGFMIGATVIQCQVYLSSVKYAD
ncbi:hypothetical protein QJS10_CPA01g02692 [Acorus calamus]|uniref:DUF641 domain-containing protein n=1 Tax=Acorus calamus TaxID=4465 RepID=A0AAV9FWH2_ACOCL|nr:hypothetical protein QJS10_CPA01g02692 [Acorus calamus]